MEMVWKGIVGGLVTAAIVWLSKRGNTLPGILPLFPTFAVIALLVVGAKGDNAGFRVALLGGLAAWLVIGLLPCPALDLTTI
jgi:uncharacterized membrane protein (GlpM family)